jgi:hypothetical protein
LDGIATEIELRDMVVPGSFVMHEILGGTESTSCHMKHTGRRLKVEEDAANVK